MDPIKRLITHIIDNRFRITALGQLLRVDVTKFQVYVYDQLRLLQQSSDKEFCKKRVEMLLKILDLLINNVQLEEVNVNQFSFMNKEDQDKFNDEIEYLLEEGMRRYLDNDEQYFIHIKDIIFLLNDEIEEFKSSWTYKNTVEAKLLLALYLMGRSSDDKKSYSQECKLKSRFFLKNLLQDYILDHLFWIGEPELFRDFIIFLQSKGLNLNKQNLPNKVSVIPHDNDEVFCDEEYAGNTFAHTLVANEEVERLTILVEECVKGNVVINWNKTDHEGKSVFSLMLRVYNEKILALAEILVDKGLVDYNLQDDHGFTPLHNCAYLGHATLFHKMANNNNINFKDINGLTPLEILFLSEASAEKHIMTHLCSLVPSRDIKSTHDHYGIKVKMSVLTEEIVSKHSQQLLAHSNLFRISHKEVLDSDNHPLNSKALLTDLVDSHAEYLKNQDLFCCTLLNEQTEKPLSLEELQKVKQNILQLSGKSIIEVCKENIVALKSEVCLKEQYKSKIAKITQKNSSKENVTKRKNTSDYFHVQNRNTKARSEAIPAEEENINVHLPESAAMKLY